MGKEQLPVTHFFFIKKKKKKKLSGPCILHKVKGVQTAYSDLDPVVWSEVVVLGGSGGGVWGSLRL